MEDRIDALIAQCGKTEEAINKAMDAWDDIITVMKKASISGEALEREGNEPRQW